MRSEEQRDKEKALPLETKWIYQGQVLTLKTETYRLDDQIKVTEIIHHSGAVVIVPVDENGRILLVQQWRRAAREITIELPAGTLKPNENPVECANRELREETGFAAKKITPLGGFYSAPGYCDEYLHLFLAEDLYRAPLPPDDDEAIDLLQLNAQDVKQMIKQNLIRDAKTIAGILRYLLCQNH